MNISKRKVVSLEVYEKELIDEVMNLLSALEDELEGEYDYTRLMDELETIKYKEFVIEDENHE